MHRNTLPRHARTGVLAVGWRKARPGETGPQPIWPIRGGSTPPDPTPDPTPPPAGPPAPGPDPDPDPTVPPTPADPPEPGDDPPLGPAGEKALAEWKRRAKEAEDREKAQAARLKEYEDRDKTEAEKLADRAAAAEERAAKATRLAVASKVEAPAASRFADPQDAVDALRPEDYVSEDGQVDTAAIGKALDELLERKPHWGVSGGGPRIPRPDPAQGPRPGGTPSVDDQIAEASAAGDWRKVLSLQNSKLDKTSK